ncbi:MAG TPA: hypothetical protein VMU50_00535 [Polyangia bacterium]|nr:hypothetical protein [Polyangia bacterium]
MTVRNSWLALIAGAILLAAASSARAQGRMDDDRRPRPPIRASATVEVIDPARGIDEIISRVRDQKNRRGDSAKDRTTKDDATGRSAGDKDDGRRPGQGSADRDSVPAPDSSDRPSFRPDRDRRDPRRQDGDARPSHPNTRQRLPRR